MDIQKFTTEFNVLFREFGNHRGAHQGSPLELEGSKQFLQFFLTGESFFFSMDHTLLDFEFVSDEVMNILGYRPDEFTAAKVIEIVHPDDRPYFLSFGYALKEFNDQIGFEKIPMYKLHYDIRLRKKEGNYIRLLYQAAVSEQDEAGILRTMGTYTDISYLKKEGIPVLSFIGMYGEPSYIDVPLHKRFLLSPDNLTARQKQILMLLSKGKASKEIACILDISKETVDRHRKNMLIKKGVHNTSELVSEAIKCGWI